MHDPETVEDLIETSRSLEHRDITRIQIETYDKYMACLKQQVQYLVTEGFDKLQATDLAYKLLQEYWENLAFIRNAEIQAIHDFARMREEAILFWGEHNVYERESSLIAST